VLNIGYPYHTSQADIYLDIGTGVSGEGSFEGNGYDRLYLNYKDRTGDFVGWHHLAVVKNLATSSMSIYLDNSLYSEFTGCTVGIENSYSLRLGSSLDSSHFWEGKVCNLKINNKALDVTRLNSGEEIYDSTTVLYPFNGSNEDAVGSNNCTLNDTTFEAKTFPYFLNAVTPLSYTPTSNIFRYLNLVEGSKRLNSDENYIKAFLSDLVVTGRDFKGNADLLSVLQDALNKEEAERLKKLKDSDVDLLISTLYSEYLDKKYSDKYKGNEDILASLIEVLELESKKLFAKQDNDFEELITIIEHLRIELLKKKRLYGSKYPSEDIFNILLFTEHDKDSLKRRSDNDFDDIIHIIDSNLHKLYGYKQNYSSNSPSEDILISSVLNNDKQIYRREDNDFIDLLMTLPIEEVVSYSVNLEFSDDYLINLEVNTVVQDYKIDLEVI